MGNESILLCTLGASWAVVPEVFAVVAPRVLDLFAHHPRARAFAAERHQRGMREPTEVWVATTRGTPRQRETLAAWWAKLDSPLPLRIWVAERTDDLTTAEECEEMRELLFRLVFHATYRVGPQAVVLSLAGGRKTMSADLQWAATIFGAKACLHVIDRALPADLRHPAPERLTAPLPANLAETLEPVFLGPFERSDLLDVSADDFPPLRPEDFPIGNDPPAVARHGVSVIRWQSAAENSAVSLVRRWQERERQRPRVYVSHLKTLLEREPRPNWYGLYRLPAAQIEALRQRRAGPELRDWVRQLPKADLHCHLGGVLDVEHQRHVGHAVWESLTASERTRALEVVKPWYRLAPWPPDWSTRLGTGRQRTAAAAALLVHLTVEELEERLYAPTLPRVALTRTHALGFRAYELPGELSGSALLQHEAGVREYARQTYRRLKADGLRYCELRGSPHKYLRSDGRSGQPLRFLTVFFSAMHEAQRDDPGLDLRFLVVLDRRHAPSDADVQFLVDAHRQFPDFVVGVDIAGDEQRAPAFHDFARVLDPVFEECLPLTIHAGEGEPADNIWQAVYRLHAERVGHGLTLHTRRDLAHRLRERGIAIEMCPTSNIEVVGYYDPDCADTFPHESYPLRSYLSDLHLDVVVCTDNPGISRTNITEEYLRASRMSGWFTVWELLALVRAGFEHAFLPVAQRAALMRECDARIGDLVTQLF